MSEQLKRTPLYEAHRQRGAKMVPFAGWEMPLQYEGIVPEHHAVRSGVGVFDVSHMGEILVAGEEATDALEWLTCNRIRSLSDGKAQYNAILNHEGGVVDDVLVYRLTEQRYLLCVNAVNTARAFTWLAENNRFQASIEDVSTDYGQLAVQGPLSAALLEELFEDRSLADMSSFHFQERELLGCPIIVARTGYTGEDGFELFVPWVATGRFWEELFTCKKICAPTAAGLGARDTLRLEACLPLHGHELSEEVSALESGIGWAVKLDKGDFVGRKALGALKAEGVPRKLAALEVRGAGIVRHGQVLCDEERNQCGIVTSGTKTPTVGKAIALALVDKECAVLGTMLHAEVRGRNIPCEVVQKPHYSR